MLEEEIYGDNSPIWEADFTMPAADGTQLGHQTGGETSNHESYLNGMRQVGQSLYKQRLMIQPLDCS